MIYQTCYSYMSYRAAQGILILTASYTFYDVVLMKVYALHSLLYILQRCSVSYLCILVTSNGTQNTF
jgi:hypothetical protein